MPEPDAPEVAAEVKRRFTERSLLLCGAEFLSMRRCLEPSGKSQKTHTNKPAKLTNGAQLKVPLFVEAGDRIVVNTKVDDTERFGTYVSRERE